MAPANAKPALAWLANHLSKTKLLSYAQIVSAVFLALQTLTTQATAVFERSLSLILLPLLFFGQSACSSVFFYPQQELRAAPDRYGIAYQDVYFQTADNLRLHAWLLAAQGEKKGSILFLHGNAENISTHLASVYWLPQEGYQVVLLDYRGYGHSEGVPDLPLILQDIERVIGDLAAKDPQAIVLFGQSLGGSLAIYAAAYSAHKDRLRAVVADSAFSSYREIARDVLGAFACTWILKWPLSLLVTDAFSPAPAVPLVSPVLLLLIHGEKDKVVPPQHSQQLFALAREPKQLWLIPQAGHIQTLQIPEYRQRFLSFLQEVYR